MTVQEMKERLWFRGVDSAVQRGKEQWGFCAI